MAFPKASLALKNEVQRCDMALRLAAQFGLVVKGTSRRGWSLSMAVRRSVISLSYININKLNPDSYLGVILVA
jgi:hypothetical protein